MSLMIRMWKMKENHQMWNHINALVTKKIGKKEKKINIIITKEEDGGINDIHGRASKNHYAIGYYQRPITPTNWRSYNNTCNQRKKLCHNKLSRINTEKD
jgi:hypothetical protein